MTIIINPHFPMSFLWISYDFRETFCYCPCPFPHEPSRSNQTRYAFSRAYSHDDLGDPPRCSSQRFAHAKLWYGRESIPCAGQCVWACCEGESRRHTHLHSREAWPCSRPCVFVSCHASSYQSMILGASRCLRYFYHAYHCLAHSPSQE